MQKLLTKFTYAQTIRSRVKSYVILIDLLIYRVTVCRYLKILIATPMSQSSAQVLSPKCMRSETPKTVGWWDPIRVLSSTGI